MNHSLNYMNYFSQLPSKTTTTTTTTNDKEMKNSFLDKTIIDSNRYTGN
jgi:hypothetical protein